MTKGQAYYRDNILTGAPIEVYTSTNTAMMEYPFILGHPEECSPTLSSQAETYIMDSKIGDESVGNEDVLRRGEDIDADVVTPADVMGNPEISSERIVDLFKSLTERDYDPTVLIPLQSNEQMDHVDHYYDVAYKLEEHGFDVTNHRISVGGIKEWTPHEQLKTMCAVRDAVGSEQFVHGLGFGVCNDWIGAIRQAPSLLDSLDMTSIVQDIVNSNKLFRPRGDRVDYKMPRGTNSTVLSAMLRQFVLYLYSYCIGPYARPTDVPTEITDDRMIQTLREYGYSETDNVQSKANA